MNDLNFKVVGLYPRVQYNKADLCLKATLRFLVACIVFQVLGEPLDLAVSEGHFHEGEYIVFKTEINCEQVWKMVAMENMQTEKVGPNVSVGSSGGQSYCNEKLYVLDQYIVPVLLVRVGRHVVTAGLKRPEAQHIHMPSKVLAERTRSLLTLRYR